MSDYAVVLTSGTGRPSLVSVEVFGIADLGEMSGVGVEASAV